MRRSFYGPKSCHCNRNVTNRCHCKRGGLYILYRLTHLLMNLGWVDFNFGCYTLCLVLPGLMGNWQNWLSCWARWWNIPNQNQPNPCSLGDGSPCRYLYFQAKVEGLSSISMRETTIDKRLTRKRRGCKTNSGSESKLASRTRRPSPTTRCNNH